MQQWHLELADEAATARLGDRLAHCLKPGTSLYLSGELGAGKTTLTRSVLQGLGHTGSVKSPTFTLVEPYRLQFDVFHFDCYRIYDPEELYFIGIEDYFRDDAVCIVEWPEKAAGVLPAADMHMQLAYLQTGRAVQCEAHSATGQALLNCLATGWTS